MLLQVLKSLGHFNFILQWPPKWGRQGPPTLLKGQPDDKEQLPSNKEVAEKEKVSEKQTEQTPGQNQMSAASPPGEEKAKYLVIKMGPNGLETFDIDALPAGLAGKGTQLGLNGKAEVFVATEKEAKSLSQLPFARAGLNGDILHKHH